jgi:signal transduction protein with GAF and PtsI domain
MPKPQQQKEKKDSKSAPERDFKTLFYRKLTENHLFYEVGRIIASELEPSELVQKIVVTIGKTVNFDDASVYIVKKDLTGLQPLYFHDPLLQSRMADSIYFDNGAPGAIAAGGEPFFLDDTALFESFLHHPDERKEHGSYIGIPLRKKPRAAPFRPYRRPAGRHL